MLWWHPKVCRCRKVPFLCWLYRLDTVVISLYKTLDNLRQQVIPYEVSFFFSPAGTFCSHSPESCSLLCFLFFLPCFLLWMLHFYPQARLQHVFGNLWWFVSNSSARLALEEGSYLLVNCTGYIDHTDTMSLFSVSSVSWKYFALLFWKSSVYQTKHVCRFSSTMCIFMSHGNFFFLFQKCFL